MTSDRQRAANRANARRSTGPSSAGGKARSSANAIRHGLSASIFVDPDLNEQVTKLARHIAGSDLALIDLAYTIAEAQFDLRRVRQVRSKLLTQALADPHYVGDRTVEKILSMLGRYVRENTLGRTRRRREDRLNRYLSAPPSPSKLDPQLVADLVKEFSRARKSHNIAHRFMIDYEVESTVEHDMLVLRELARELARLDRYERRALSRRKFAVRELDAARALSVNACLACDAPPS